VLEKKKEERFLTPPQKSVFDRGRIQLNVIGLY